MHEVRLDRKRRLMTVGNTGLTGTVKCGADTVWCGDDAPTATNRQS